MDIGTSKGVTAPGLPTPRVYELEYQFWPWGQVLTLVEDWVVEHAPQFGYVVDYMCGCGYLLDAISRRRPDLRLHGNSFDRDWIEYGREHYPSIDIEFAHSLEFSPREQVDIAIVTGSIHHLLPPEQPQFIARVRNAMSRSGFFLVGEEVISLYSNDNERRLAVLMLGNMLMSHVIERQAPDLVLEAAVDLLKRDMFCAGEYKISLSDLKAMIEVNFAIDRCDAVWPSPEIGFGDYFMVCKPKGQERIDNEL